MIVYRFERDGFGPYISRTGVLVQGRPKTRTQKKYSNVLNRACMTNSLVDRHTAWNKAHADDTHMYGCPSKEMLRAYFGGNFKDLFKHGFRIKRYVVPDEEIIDMITEVAFPVKYHKLQSVTTLRKKMKTLNSR